MNPKLTSNSFSSNSFYFKPIESEASLQDKECVSLFDQNGYHLTTAEQKFAKAHQISLCQRRHEVMMCSDWMIAPGATSIHFNHCELFERKGFEQEARSQLLRNENKNPLLWKLIKMKPKWGIDVSIDYVRKDEWCELVFFEQSDWKANFYGVTPERFKNIIWEI